MGTWPGMTHLIKEWIEENPAEVPPLSQMAARLGYSCDYTARMFRRTEGIPLRQYVANRRLARAAADLYLSGERLLDVALRYGYSSQEALTRAFVSAYGLPPAAYRRLRKPTADAQKSGLLNTVRGNCKPEGGLDMKLSVKQMYDWNCYAYVAEDVAEAHWDYFKSELWWQLGNGFIKTFDNVPDFSHCAANFEKHGETAVMQQLGLLPAPWEKALRAFAAAMDAFETPCAWYVHGSAALALWGIPAAPKDVNIIIPNASDFEAVRARLHTLAIRPFERCENWLMSGLGDIFLDVTVSIAFHNEDMEPFDLQTLAKRPFHGRELYVATLETLRQDNINLNRLERVRAIEARLQN